MTIHRLELLFLDAIEKCRNIGRAKYLANEHDAIFDSRLEVQYDEENKVWTLDFPAGIDIARAADIAFKVRSISNCKVIFDTGNTLITLEPKNG